jgi:hypothetical protein
MKKLLAVFLLSLSTLSFGDIINVPPIPPTAVRTMCITDLVDSYGSIVRSFSGNGYDMNEACRQSDQFCRYELQRHDTYGYRCLTRNGGYPQPPRPPQQTTEQCQVSRLDPAGFFIQSYYGTATGPWGSNVKDQACRNAYQACSYDLRGRQTCRVDG